MRGSGVAEPQMHALPQKPQPQFRTSINTLYIVSQGLRKLGIDPDPWFSAHGFDSSGIKPDLRKRIPIDRFLALMDTLLRETGDPTLHLKIADATQFGELPLFDYFTASCDTLATALSMFDRYSRLVDESTKLNCHSGKTHFWIDAVHQGSGEMPPVLLDMYLVNSYNRLSALVGRRLEVSEICIRDAFRSPAVSAYFVEKFRLSLKFGQAFNRMVFAGDANSIPCISGNSLMRNVFLRETIKLFGLFVAPTENDKTLLRRVTTHVENQIYDLGDNDFSLYRVASQLGVSERSLQRKLKECGSAYSDLLARIRRNHLPLLVSQLGDDWPRIASILGLQDPDRVRQLRSSPHSDPA